MGAAEALSGCRGCLCLVVGRGRELITLSYRGTGPSHSRRQKVDEAVAAEWGDAIGGDAWQGLQTVLSAQQGAQARDAGQHPTGHRTDLQSELSGLTCQQHQG